MSWVEEETQHQNSGHVSVAWCHWCKSKALFGQRSKLWMIIRGLQVLEESNPHFPLPIGENPQIPGGFGSRVMPLSSAESSSSTPQNSVFIPDLCKFLFLTHLRCYSFMEIMFWISHYIFWTGQEKEKEQSRVLGSALQLKLDTSTGLGRLLYRIWNS